MSVALLALLIAMAARRLLAAEFLDSWARALFGQASFAIALAERLLFWLAILLVVANLSRVFARR